MAKTKQVERPPVDDTAPDPEMPDDFLRGVMYEWGRQTYSAWSAVKDSYPGWGNILATMYGLVDDVLGAE